jgi:hypothetical protein
VPAPPPAPSPELVARTEELQRQVEELASRLTSAADHSRRAAREADDAEHRVAERQASLPPQAAATKETAAQLAADEAALQNLQKQIENLERQRQALAEDESRSTEVLGHRVTPIARESQGEEVHFQLSGGRVSVIPMEEFAAALKEKIERQRDLLFRLERYDGELGPVQGFRMQFVVERQPVSVLEELRNGGPMLRIGLSYYEIVRQPDAPSESLEEALLPQSRFRRAIDTAPADAVLTFWVYPDSFEMHRALQEYAHAAGYRVAGRPLPEGVPIAGSPQGARSTWQ